mmetsp:Transcript_25732/g.64620  ORF Transcript_25732/g.64620 Transcript_25732/m.64620 type:complete len:838 (-) Transcript_25732:132-2645(-)
MKQSPVTLPGGYLGEYHFLQLQLASCVVGALLSLSLSYCLLEFSSRFCRFVFHCFFFFVSDTHSTALLLSSNSYRSEKAAPAATIVGCLSGAKLLSEGAALPRSSVVTEVVAVPDPDAEPLSTAYQLPDGLFVCGTYTSTRVTHASQVNERALQAAGALSVALSSRGAPPTLTDLVLVCCVGVSQAALRKQQTAPQSSTSPSSTTSSTSSSSVSSVLSALGAGVESSRDEPWCVCAVFRPLSAAPCVLRVTQPGDESAANCELASPQSVCLRVRLPLCVCVPLPAGQSGDSQSSAQLSQTHTAAALALRRSLEALASSLRAIPAERLRMLHRCSGRVPAGTHTIGQLLRELAPRGQSGGGGGSGAVAGCRVDDQEVYEEPGDQGRVRMLPSLFLELLLPQDPPSSASSIATSSAARLAADAEQGSFGDADAPDAHRSSTTSASSVVAPPFEEATASFAYRPLPASQRRRYCRRRVLLDALAYLPADATCAQAAVALRRSLLAQVNKLARCCAAAAESDSASERERLAAALRLSSRVEPDSASASCAAAAAEHFLPEGLGHRLSVLLPPDSEDCEAARIARAQLLGRLLLLPADRPLLRRPLRLYRAERSALLREISDGKLLRVHTHASASSGAVGGSEEGSSRVYGVQGPYVYYHYLQDREQDAGWGCAYRSLQTICSWFALQGYVPLSAPPTHRQIQETLVRIGDKQPRFAGSREWIGAIELSLCLDALYGVSCRVLNLRSGAEFPQRSAELAAHFEREGTPIMIGGGVLAYTLLAVDWNQRSGEVRYLILDPHYEGSDQRPRHIVQKGWVAWKSSKLFLKDRFYNLLLPQRPHVV